MGTRDHRDVNDIQTDSASNEHFFDEIGEGEIFSDVTFSSFFYRLGCVLCCDMSYFRMECYAIGFCYLGLVCQFSTCSSRRVDVLLCTSRSSISKHIDIGI